MMYMIHSSCDKSNTHSLVEWNNTERFASVFETITTSVGFQNYVNHMNFKQSLDGHAEVWLSAVSPPCLPSMTRVCHSRYTTVIS